MVIVRGPIVYGIGTENQGRGPFYKCVRWDEETHKVKIIS